MSRVLSSTTRPFRRTWGTTHADLAGTAGDNARPCSGGALTLAPLPVVGAGNRPFAGMDPSDPATYVRPWNPQPGMIAYLNFDGAAAQGETSMGGTWMGPGRRRAQVAARPRKRPR